MAANSEYLSNILKFGKDLTMDTCLRRVGRYRMNATHPGIIAWGASI